MTSGRRLLTWAIGLTAAGLAAAGCGDSGDDATDHGTPDAADEGTGETLPDSPDAEPDVPAETPGEAADVEPEGSVDANDVPDDSTDADDGGPVGLPVGSPCTDGGECRDGLVPGECFTSLGTTTWRDGYCSAFNCRNDEECPGGPEEAACLRLGEGNPLCLALCDGPAACRTGYSCLDPDGPGGLLPGVCLPFCDSNADCAEGQTCDLAAEPPLCRSAVTVGNGEACTESGDCLPDSYCLGEGAFMGGFPGGICTQECTAAADCTNGGVCVLSCEDENRTPGDDCDDDGSPGLDPDERGLCLLGCDPAADPDECDRDGYSCRSVGENVEGPVDACVVDCTEASGGCETPGWECDPAGGALGQDGFGLGRCQPPFDPDQLGDPCTLTAGCVGGVCLAESFSGYPGGLCIEECIRGSGTVTGDPCPGLAICAADAGQGGSCLDLCRPDETDCRDAWACTNLGGGGGAWICQPACTRSDQCDYGCCTDSPERPGFCDPLRRGCLP